MAEIKHKPVEIDIANLSVSKLNVRRYGGKDIKSLARTIDSVGLIYPLLVRELADDGEPNRGGGASSTRQRNVKLYEVVAGKRRFFALKHLERETAPCIVLSASDDAAAIELSLIENTERVAMDPLDQCNAYLALVKEGRDEAEIAHTFSTTVPAVRRRLALAGLVPEAHKLYREGTIDDKVLEALTLGSKERQRAYLKLASDPEQTAPPVWQLKQWMLGGDSIDTKAALFPIGDYEGTITTDLFQETSYFTDCAEFWDRQRKAITETAEGFKAKGWQTVTVLEPDQPYYGHQWHPATKAEGGHVILKLNPDGHVQIEKGLMPQAQAKARAKEDAREQQREAAASATPDATVTADYDNRQPELSSLLTNYTDLVRHSTVAAALIKKPKIALRLMVASILTGTPQVSVQCDPRQAVSSEIAQSVKALGSEAEQADAKTAALGTLGLSSGDGDNGGDLLALRHTGLALPEVFDLLMALTDAQVLGILAVIAAESLTVGSAVIDPLGQLLKADVRTHWTPDMTLLGLVRGRDVIESIASEVLGDDGARACIGTMTHAKGVIAEALKKRNDWQPRWTQFPQARYRDSADAGGHPERQQRAMAAE